MVVCAPRRWSDQVGRCKLATRKIANTSAQIDVFLQMVQDCLMSEREILAKTLKIKCSLLLSYQVHLLGKEQ